MTAKTIRKTYLVPFEINVTRRGKLERTFGLAKIEDKDKDEEKNDGEAKT